MYTVRGKKPPANGKPPVVIHGRLFYSAQFCGNTEEGEADVVGLPGIHIEVKRVERLNIDEALEQSSRDAAKTDHAVPIVLHRRNNTPWKVTMDAHEWFRLYREWEAGGKP